MALPSKPDWMALALARHLGGAETKPKQKTAKPQGKRDVRNDRGAALAFEREQRRREKAKQKEEAARERQRLRTLGMRIDCQKDLGTAPRALKTTTPRPVGKQGKAVALTSFFGAQNVSHRGFHCHQQIAAQRYFPERGTTAAMGLVPPKCTPFED